jgi:hypothetical protein
MKRLFIVAALGLAGCGSYNPFGPPQLATTQVVHKCPDDVKDLLAGLPASGGRRDARRRPDGGMAAAGLGLDLLQTESEGKLRPLRDHLK